MARNSIIDENKSIILKTSPVKINIPFIKRRNAQKSRNCTKTDILNASIRNAIAEVMSIVPRIFTSMIY